MAVVKLNGKEVEVKIVDASEMNNYISKNDIEMDKRASAAVKAAIDKAKVCNKPVAKYDKAIKKAYLEYPNGEKKYVE
jgi:hypothetical protein